MSKIIDSLKKRIGRVKKNMENILLGIGGVLLSAGLPILATSQNSLMKGLSLIAIFIGIIVTGVSIGLSRDKEYKDKKLRHFDMGASVSIYEELQKMNGNIEKLLDEIREDRQHGESKPDTKPQTPNSNTTK